MGLNDFPVNLSTCYCEQGGPHNHTIGGLAVSLKHAKSPEFKAYQNKVLGVTFGCLMVHLCAYFDTIIYPIGGL